MLLISERLLNQLTVTLINILHILRAQGLSKTSIQSVMVLWDKHCIKKMIQKYKNLIFIFFAEKELQCT